MSGRFREAVLPYGILQKEFYTEEDYARLPEGAPFQLIGGKLIMTPSPGKRHQQVLLKMAKLLDTFVENKKIGELTIAPRDVYLSSTEIYQPDILFIAKDRLEISAEERVNGAPDLVMEVLSPSTAYYDLKKKYKAYEKYGVKEYWMVDPEEQSIEIYRLSGGKYQLAARAERTGEIASVLLSGFSVRLQDVFPEG